jgi:hypothetical protein
MLPCVSVYGSWQDRENGLAVPGSTFYLKGEGLVINHKRTERIYHEEGLALRRKRRRKGAAGSRVLMPSPPEAKPALIHGFRY